MLVTADDVLVLAKSIRSLSEEQLQRIQDVVAFMSDADLEMLRGMLEGVQAEEVRGMKKELEIRRAVAAEYEEYKADRARGKRVKAEKSERLGEEKVAEELLNKI